VARALGHRDTARRFLTPGGSEKTVGRAVGMLALAVWDKASRILTLARDRLGEKPLYYGWQGNAFLFGSELKALRCHSEFRGEINRDALRCCCGNNYIPAPYSIYRDVYKLPAGTCLQINPRERNAQPVPYCPRANTPNRDGVSSTPAVRNRRQPDLEELIKAESLQVQMVGGRAASCFFFPVGSIRQPW